MKNQYLQPYKNHVLDCINSGKELLAVGTFIVYKLRGNAKSWSGRYINSLKNNLIKEGWIECLSRKKGVAYKPANCL